jgi:hypothetical protein
MRTLKSGAVERLDDAPVGASRTSTDRSGRHPLAMQGIAADGEKDLALAGERHTENHGQVLLDHLTRRELPDEGLVGRIVLGDDEQAGGPPVESVDDPRAKHTADAREVGDVGEKGIYESAGRNPCPWMNDEAGRLLENEKSGMSSARGSAGAGAGTTSSMRSPP